jgi:hypothetical protein
MLFPNNIPIPRDHNEKVPLPLIDKQNHSNPRLVYQETVMHVALLLRGRQSQCSMNKLKVTEDFKTPTEPSEMLLQVHQNLFNKYQALFVESKKLGHEPSEQDLESQHKQDVLIRVNKYCIEQAVKAHEAKNYA